MFNTIVATEQTPVFERAIFKHTLNDKRGMSVHVYLFANDIPEEMFGKLLGDMHIFMQSEIAGLMLRGSG